MTDLNSIVCVKAQCRYLMETGTERKSKKQTLAAKMSACYKRCDLDKNRQQQKKQYSLHKQY